MKLKLGALVSAQPALDDLASKQLVAKTAFRIARNLRIIAGERELYEQQRIALAKKYGTLDAEHSQYRFANGNGEKFIEELNALMNTEVENGIMPIPLSDLADVKMSAGDMAMLDWLIEDADTASAANLPG
jgi:hypothetical protein